MVDGHAQRDMSRQRLGTVTWMSAANCIEPYLSSLWPIISLQLPCSCAWHSAHSVIRLESSSEPC
jgi:hypothetical protein